MRLAGAVIRILPQDHDADALDRRQVERAEPLGPAREDAAARRLLGDEELLERRHIGLIEFARERREPARTQVDCRSRHPGGMSEFPSSLPRPRRGCPPPPTPIALPFCPPPNK